MRSNRAWEQQALINELKQGRQLAKQLKNHLTASSETRHFLVEKIISSYEKTLTKLNRSSDSSLPLSPCSRSQAGSNHQVFRDASKKSKAFPKWTEQVQVKSETGLEGPPDDGHGWRKYGQKDILGAIHPRGYYRCTHRHAQGCLATKHVQRSDQDPTVFHITYRGQHTCIKTAHRPQEAGVIKPVASPIQFEQQKRRKLDDQFGFSFEANIFPTSGYKPDDDYMFISSEDQFMSAAEGSFYISPATTSDSEFFPVGESEGSCLNSVSNSPMGVLDFPIGCGGMDFDSSFLLGFLDFQ